MLLLRDLWGKHRRKVLLSVGVVGCGYFVYTLYYVHKRKLQATERELACQREYKEVITAQARSHFERIQVIADTTTLPQAINILSEQIAKELDLSHITNKLQRGKDEPNTLTISEKRALWNRLKILSFTRMAVSVWSATLLSLHSRVQVNILGRHLYLRAACMTASVHEGIHPVEDDESDQHKFLTGSRFPGLPAFIRNMEEVATQVLKGKELSEVLTRRMLTEITQRMVESPLSSKPDSNRHWLLLLGGEETETPSSSSSNAFMAEARAVLSSDEFVETLEASLRSVVDAVIDGLESQIWNLNLDDGVQLAMLVPRVAWISDRILDTTTTNNQFFQILKNLPQADRFFTILYSAVPQIEQTHCSS